MTIRNALDEARAIVRRSSEERASDTMAARDRAVDAITRQVSLLRDAVDGALATGVSWTEITRRLGLDPAAAEALLGNA